MKTIVCFGPGPMFKGGIANYNTSLARAFDQIEGCQVHIVSWTQQYPSIIPRDFIDRKSKTDLLQGTNIQVHYITNYNNPLTWHKTVKLIRSLKPDIVIFQWAIAIQGLPIAYIAHQLKKQTSAEIIFDLHFVIQKEHSKIDRLFTKMALKHAHTYIVHALKTYEELKELFPYLFFDLVPSGRTDKPDHISVLRLYHPVYKLFEPDPRLNVKELKKQMNLRQHVFLFFGFIRKYKGLHNVIEAFHRLTRIRQDVSLLIVGEAFWNTLDQRKLSTRFKKFLFGLAKRIFLRKSDDESNYRPLELIEKYQLHPYVYQHIDFVPNEEVHKYFQVSDVLVLFYEYATPSGVESIGYNFRIPMIATAVGHFPETISDGFNGYLAQPDDIDSMVQTMLKAIEQPIPRDHVAQTAAKMSWENYARAILNS